MEGQNLEMKAMTNLEYEILDELYFVQTFDSLKLILQFEETILKQTLWQLIDSNLVKCMLDFDIEVTITSDDFEVNFKKYHYIASKKGLFLHNSR